MANRYVKRWSTLLSISKTKTKTTVKYLLTTITMAIIKKTRNNKGWQRCGEKETLVCCCWECKLVHHYGKQYAGSSKN